jgi:hypothetical protein
MNAFRRRVEILEEFAAHAKIFHDRLWRWRRIARSPRVRMVWALPPPAALGVCNCSICRRQRGAISKSNHVRIAWALACFLGGGR